MSAKHPPSLAAASDLAIFKNAELTGVNVWKSGVSISFDDEPLSITVKSNAEFQTQGRTEIYSQEIITAFGARVLSLLGRHVTDVMATDDRMLVLSFDDGSKLTLRPDESGYECYTVHLPNGSTFVGL
jgi:hypothetical protein